MGLGEEKTDVWCPEPDVDGSLVVIQGATGLHTVLGRIQGEWYPEDDRLWGLTWAQVLASATTVYRLTKMASRPR